MTFELAPKQRAVRDRLGGPETHCLVYGGSRSGKTFLFCYAIGARAIRAPGSRHLIARSVFSNVKGSVALDTWPKMMRLAHPGVAWKMDKSDWYAQFGNGSEVWFGGLDQKDRVDKVLGKEFATVYVNEASEVAREAITTLRTRLAQTVMVPATKDRPEQPLKLKAYYDLNPAGKGHWTYREFVEGLRPEDGQPVDRSDFCFDVMNPVDNPHLLAAYLRQLEALPDRQRKRFLEGVYLADVPGALWTSEMLEGCKVVEAPDLARVVVAVDPAVTHGENSDETGIVVAGRIGHGETSRAFVLADVSGRRSPLEWARVAVAEYERHKADVIVAESNNGGELVRQNIQTVAPRANVQLVNASRGKQTRAEPIAALYEQGRVHHVGGFPALEDQMCSWVPGVGKSPDRVDAMVWALTDLMLDQVEPARMVRVSFG
jgi:phage terminase large subunit-like protein